MWQFLALSFFALLRLAIAPRRGGHTRMRLIGEAFHCTNHANWAGIQNTRCVFSNGIFMQRTNLPGRTGGGDPGIPQLVVKITF